MAVHNILGMSSSQLIFRFFRGVETTNQIFYISVLCYHMTYVLFIEVIKSHTKWGPLDS